LRKSSPKRDQAHSNYYCKKDFKREKESPLKNPTIDKEKEKGKRESSTHTH